MHGDGHVGRFHFENLVQDCDVLAAHGVDVDAPLGVGFALIGRAEFAPRRVVELQIAAARVVKSPDGFLIGCGDVRKERVFVLVAFDRLVIGFADAADEVQHGRRRDGLLGRRFTGNALQEAEVVDEGMIVREIDFAADLQSFCFRLEAVEGDGKVLCLYFVDAVEAPEEIEVPEGAAVFAVGHGFEAGFLFVGYELADALVFLFFQGSRRDLSCFKGLTRFLQFRFAQKAADNIVTVRDSHNNIPPCISISTCIFLLCLLL